MKVIDLLNKIANGEEVPRKIEYDSIIYTRGWSDYMGDEPITEYYNHDIYGSWFNGTELTLDKEVEIIEEDKEIEEIEPITGAYDSIEVIGVFLNRINRLIKAVNEIKKGK
jgi:hypothetical protein